MSTTDLRFFTNEPERDLYSRFTAILKSNTQFFDVLVGYFRTSGFFRMWESMKEVDKVRVLVGLNVDRFTIKLIDQSNNEIKLAAIPSKEGLEMFANEVVHEFEQAEVSGEVEKGVRVFIDWLKSGKLEMRIYTQAPIHSKVYIMRKNPHKVFDTFGSVITGSSNFTEAGLRNNLEFNVELKDYPDVKFALDRFESLWDKSVDIIDTYVDCVEKKTWMRGDITPYQLYLKTLYEFFKEEINADKENFNTLLPEGYMRLQYQIDAVMQARQKLEAYNGVFISDVVGLGKTYICAMLANSFNRNSYKLIICPPVLVEYWRSVLQEFDVSRCDVESLGKLDQINAKGTDRYQYIFVDEAHRFRNSDTVGFTELHQICRGKKVILISATPINNYTSDIENQLYLFQNKQSGTINGIRNLEGFFRGLESTLKKFEKGTPEYLKQLRDNSEIIRDRLLREIMIRRTRSEIAKYYAVDLERQGLSFPKVGSPGKIVYTFDERTDEAFTETIEQIKGFRYARYTPLLYLRDKKKYATLMAGQRNMGGFMKGILVKRLESSFYAFKKTLERFVESYERFIAMYDSGVMHIGKNKNIYEMLDNGDDEKLLYLIEQGEIWKFSSDEFSVSFIRDLRSDLAQLRTWQSLWNQIKVDPKLIEFKKSLMEDAVMKGQKVIVFTESTETAEYLCENLAGIYNERVIQFSGKSSTVLKSEIEDSFNPRYKDSNNDRYDLLITTDVLAEGVNLHRANVLINYDLPWNPTRIMQRVGRINRVGTAFDRIHVYNFFPTAQSSRQLPLEVRILEKLQAFHDTLGEDIKYLSDEEQVSPKKLFADLNVDLDAEEESNNPELAYLAIIRQIRDEQPELFDNIKRLPKKCKAGKKHPSITEPATISFIKKGALKTFFSSDRTAPKQMTFIEAIGLIEASPDDKQISVGSDYYVHLAANDHAFDEMVIADEAVSIEKPMVAGNDAKVIRLLKAIKNDSRLTDTQEDTLELLISRWENGEMPARIAKDVLKKSTVPMDTLELYYEILKLVPETYIEVRETGKSLVEGEKQVILSCYLTREEDK